MARYVPSGKVGLPGFATVACLSLAAAVAGGVLFHFIGRLIYLILVFPAVWGVALGAGVALSVRVGKCRSVSLAAAWGILAPVASYAVFHVLENAQVRSTYVSVLLLEKDATPESARRRYDEELRREYGSDGFWGELAHRADMGMSIQKVGRGSSAKEPTIRGVGMYVYWAVELGVVALCAFFLPLSAARQPFCEPCRTWFVKKEIAALDDARAEEGLRALERRDFRAFAACVGAGAHALSLEKCPKCSESPVRVLVEAVTQDAKGNKTRKKVFDDMFERRDAAALLTEGLGPPPQPPA